MATVETSQQSNGYTPVTAHFKNFVKSHQATLEYLQRFGNPLERAKAGILMELAAGEG
jgi:hypothetical protein